MGLEKERLLQICNIFTGFESVLKVSYYLAG